MKNKYKSKYIKERKRRLYWQKKREEAKSWAYLLITILAIVLASVFIKENTKTQTISITIDTSEDTTVVVPTPLPVLQQPTQNYDLLPTELTGTQEENRTYIEKYLKSRGEESNLATWAKIIKQESGYDPRSKAPTYWSLCDRAVVVTLWGYKQPANRFIELRDYPNGIWQATCEEYGAQTIRTGYSRGLTHIIEPTWEELGCTGDINNWTDQIDCSLKIRNNRGWNSWSSY